MIFVIELKRRMTGADILGIIISKLHHKKKPCPIILFEIDKNPKVGFYCAILPLSLAVCLQVESVGESLLDA